MIATGPRCTVGVLMAEARIAGVERFDALAMIGHGLGRTRAWLIAHDDDIVNELGASFCRGLFNRYLLGEPLAYLLETKEFHGLELRVTPQVLIPRADTETLVDWALDLLAGPLAHIAAPRVLDLGTGSGAIALAIKSKCQRAAVRAFDISADALDVARSNAAELELDVRFAVSDWWAAAGQDRFDLVVSNPPYIADADPHLPALKHEPITALVSGPDGTDDLKKIISQAPEHLNTGAWLLVEHGWDQGAKARDLFDSMGSAWTHVETRRDLPGHERCTGASFS